MMQVDHIEIAKLSLEAGDLLVLRVPADWGHDQQVAAHDAVKEAMRKADVNVPIIIGPDTVEFQVIRKADR